MSGYTWIKILHVPGIKSVVWTVFWNQLWADSLQAIKVGFRTQAIYFVVRHNTNGLKVR